MYMTPWVQRLLVANVVIFFVSQGVPSLARSFAFIPAYVILRPWTLVTYMFLHADTWHLLFNMLGLFFFGPRLETRLQGKGFLALYFLAGIGGALFTFVFDRNVAMIGASGAVLGIVAAYATLWPRDQILIWGILPVEAWLLAMFAVFASVWSGIVGGGNVAHFAHLGGLAFGYLYMRAVEARSARRKQLWREGKDVGKPRTAASSKRVKKEETARWEGIRREGLHKLNREEVDALLDKISAEGVQSLTADERAFLDRMASSG